MLVKEEKQLLEEQYQMCTRLNLNLDLQYNLEATPEAFTIDCREP